MAPNGELVSAIDGERYLKIPVCVIDRRAFWRDCLTKCLTISEANLHAEGFEGIQDWLKASVGEPSTIVLLCASGRQATDIAIEHDLETIIEMRPTASVVIVSDIDSPAIMIAALERGARGFVTMSLSLDVAIEAIRIVKVGGTFIPASGLLSARETYVAVSQPQPDTAAGAHTHFTERQLAIIACVRKGEPNKIIAHKLNMTESTVKVHIRNIMRKIKAKNRTEVAFLTNELLLPGETPLRR